MAGPRTHRNAIGRVPPRPGARFAALALAAGVALASCSEQSPAGESVGGSPPVQAAEARPFNIRDVFPEGPGRELVLDNCQSCHVLVPILVLRMDKAAWYRNSLEHRERVERLDDDDFEILYDYLTSTFTPDSPVPELPAALLDTWTTY